MSRLVLVRHGAAAAGWDADTDPGLSDVGRAQAEAAAARLGASDALPIVVSPLRRCRETAQPLERRWGTEATVDPRVGEIESPGLDVQARGLWLRSVMAGTWAEAGVEQQRWRDRVVDALVETAGAGDAVVVSHFVAINAAIGAAAGDDRVLCARLDNCSLTTIDVVGGRLSLVEVGTSATTEVL